MSGRKRKAAGGGPEGVLTTSRKDGPKFVRGAKRWTAEDEAVFLDHLAASCNVTASAAEAGFTKVTVYNKRRLDPGFAGRWQAALEQGYARLEMLLVQTATDWLSGDGPDPDAPVPVMTVREAVTILQLHRASVKGGGARPAGWRGRPRSLDEMRDSILAKLEAFEAERRAAGRPALPAPDGPDA